jgi:TPR repeat protein
MLWKGFEGVPQNRLEAAKFFLLAAEKGDVESQHIMGCLCLDESNDKSSSEGAEWLLKAARQGHEASQWRLGVLYKKIDIESGLWFKDSVSNTATRTAAISARNSACSSAACSATKTTAPCEAHCD